MKDYIEFENNYRFFTNQDNVNILNEILNKIKENNLDKDALVEVLKDIDAEVSHDILKDLEKQQIINYEDYHYIDSELIKIYEKEFVEEMQNGDFESRMKLSLAKNRRLISRYEILGIYFSKTLDSKLLFGLAESDDEILTSLAKVNRELGLPKLSNRLYKKQNELLDVFKAQIFESIENLDIQKTS